MADDLDEVSSYPTYISNAGLVLAAPFLQRLFELLDMLKKTEKNHLEWRDAAAVSRAVHLTQFLVDGRTDSPEPLLVLNKVICGIPIEQPVEAKIAPTGEEKSACENLLQSMISNWPILSNTSIAALRETFMQREGKLEGLDDRWTLRVQRKTVDVLVDRIPWSISVIRLPWMPKPLYVTW